MITNELEEIRNRLQEIADRQSIKVWRIARRAEAKGCSADLVNEIRAEGHDLYSNYKTYPERLLDNNAKYKLKYAFCGERRKHTFLIVNGDDEIVKIERKRI